MKTNIHLGLNSIILDQVVKAKEQMTKCLCEKSTFEDENTKHKTVIFKQLYVT